ncbi:hypothetical protein ACZ87_03470 [Candidatus Erwinia dacicola]|uniref:Uncharacterized protein n=1 Tax=Candidatus Erwinia dacicola TaxID=252393 RepID=A0A328TL56_9GAMM|nr:hypothetical protein ACZ87_03470 [Candidatus Erwinia dacicola]
MLWPVLVDHYSCLSRLLVKRQAEDVEAVRCLAADVLNFALCRKNGALS